MFIVTSLGKLAVSILVEARRMSAYAAAVVRLALDRRAWSRSTLQVLSKQIYFSGVVALTMITLLAFLIGIVVVAQSQVWLSTIGQSDLLGSVTVNLLIRGIGPLLVGFVLIGRSGTAICAELAGMRSRGELHVLDAHGIDPTIYLVMPRALALALSSFSLTIIFVAVSVLAGWLAGVLVGWSEMTVFQFLDKILSALTLNDFIALGAKSLLGGLIIGVVCCMEGMNTRGVSTEIPQAVTRGVVLSMTALVVFFALVTLITSI